MSMEQVRTGKGTNPRRIVLYGVHGIGKSSWAASAPNPIMIPTEDGLEDIGVDRFPLAHSFDEVMTNLKNVFEEKHSYKTVAIDSLDWAEKLIFAEVCKAKNVESIEDIGYAKGYTFALDYWRKLLDALNYVRSERGMTVILVAHSQVTRFEDPEQESYDRYVPQLHKHAAALVTQWADEVLFATYKTFVKTTEEGFNKKRARGMGAGERVVRTTERPAHVAKNRLNLPDELPLVWAEFEKYVKANNTAAPETAKPKKQKEVVNG